ncbi:MAG: ferritin-like domain-containing protein, partial [Chlamydiae bacterium]|nr:ferritin-like domain-containing protein [Chlamydiota bacterium]
MEVREWCIRILSADTLEEKLLLPPSLTDEVPGPPMIWDTPTRPRGLEFKRHSKEEKLPSQGELAEADKRAICLHRFAGHELLAVEIMAAALLAFPTAPPSFRKGLIHTLKEEQGHVQLYQDRLQALGVELGDMPLYKHFWRYVPFLITSPIRYVSVMSLTFEMANLDFAPTYQRSFAKHGDALSALLMQRIAEDEIRHVSFGMTWIKKSTPMGHSSWDTWRAHTPDLLLPKRARGPFFHQELRQRAGV